MLLKTLNHVLAHDKLLSSCDSADFSKGSKEVQYIHISLILPSCYSLRKPSVLFQEGSETAVTIAVAILLLLRQLYGSRRILCLDHVEQKVSVKCILLENATRSNFASEIFSIASKILKSYIAVMSVETVMSCDTG